MTKFIGLSGLAIAAALGLAASAASANTLVVSGDEWQLSNFAYDAPYTTGTQGFVASLAATFGGTNYLLLSGNGNVPGSQLSLAAAQLTSLGKTVTLSPTFATGYDAVFHFGQAIDISAVENYFTGGGNVYISLGSGIYGSAAAEAAAWNPFLANHGLVAGSEWFSTAYRNSSLSERLRSGGRSRNTRSVSSTSSAISSAVRTPRSTAKPSRSNEVVASGTSVRSGCSRARFLPMRRIMGGS